MNWQPDRSSHIALTIQIVQWITEQITSGTWAVGTKLPTQRQLASLLQVNRSTIQEVMDELKAEGILTAKVGAGTYVTSNSWTILKQPNWQHYIEASIHKPNYETIQLINELEQREAFIRLSTGELAPSLIPTAAIEASLKSLSFDSKTLGYSSPQGSLKLREAICAYVKKRGIDTTPAHICIVSGGLQALQLIALGLLEAGSIVFQEGASYLHSVHPFQSFGMRLQTMTHNFPTKPKHTQAIVYTIPTLNNPTGRVWSLSEREQFYAHCTEANLPIIEDDVYSELLFDQDIRAMKSFDTTGQVLYIGSVSKTLSPGLRIGWVIATPAVIKRLADIKMQMDYGSSAISQAIVAHWLTSGLYEQHAKTMRLQLRQRADKMEQLLQQHFAQIATWQCTEGGFYIWLRFHEPIVTNSLFLALVKRHVLINPGYIYTPHDHHHIRLSYAYATESELAQGLMILYEEAMKTSHI